MLFKIKTPGSLMIIGEHAVLHGFPAIACAIDKFITVEMEAINDGYVEIKSSSYSIMKFPLSLLSDIKDNQYKFVLAGLKVFTQHYPVDEGFKLNIQSDIPQNVGFGSSAAVVVATIKVLSLRYGIGLSEKRLFELAIQSVLLAQNGIGSGSDIAASICCGMVKMQNGEFQKLNAPLLNIVVIYSGYKTKTTDVVKIVQNNAQKHHDAFESVYYEMGQCVQKFIKAINDGTLKTISICFNEYQDLLKQLGVADEMTIKILYGLRKIGICAGKISGSGLGDCIIGLINDDSVIQNFNIPGATVMNVNLINVGANACEQAAVC